MALTPEKLERLQDFFTHTSRIKFVNINLEKTTNKYTLDVEVADSIKPLSIERLNLVQDLLGYSDIFDFIKIKIPTEPLQLVINTDGTSVDIKPTEQYTFIVNENINTFSLKIGNLNDIVITNYYEITNFSQCKISIDSSNPQISASNYEVFVTQSTQLSTINNNIFTLYYLTTGSLVLGFTPANKEYPDTVIPCTPNWSEWTPVLDDPSTFCTDVLVGTQSRTDSNGCYPEEFREVYGTKESNWSAWSPALSTVCDGETFTQTRTDLNGCFTEPMTQEAIGTMEPAWSEWTPEIDPSTACEGVLIGVQSRTDSNGCVEPETRDVYGTKLPNWSEWEPVLDDPSTVCEGTLIGTQTRTDSNGCYGDETRDVYGTIPYGPWSPWTPDVSEICAGVTFTQMRFGEAPCGGDQSQEAVGTKQPTWSAWSPALSTVCEGVSFTQTRTDLNGCLEPQTQGATGTLVCGEPTAFWSGWSSEPAYTAEGTATFSVDGDALKLVPRSGLSSFTSTNTSKGGSLDASNCTNLIELVCWNNNLNSINVSECTNLSELNCSGNQITSLDTTGLANLEYLQCGNCSQLTSINASGCTSLTTLNVAYNRLTSLNVAGCTSLVTLNCYTNQLQSLDVSGLTSLTTLNCGYENYISSINASGCTSLTNINWMNNPLSSINITGCTNWVNFSYTRKQLQSFIVTGCTSLATINCSYNNIETIDVSELTSLTSLDFTGNPVSSLNVTGCTSLVYIGMYNSSASSLSPASMNTVLEALDQNGATNGTFEICYNLNQLDQNLIITLQAKGWTFPSNCGAQ